MTLSFRWSDYINSGRKKINRKQVEVDIIKNEKTPLAEKLF